ncbi:hypothetical protein LJB91_03145, partial [Bacteroidales bacterium OttesenSCG-928-L03]|nr:hypothetical protein [Bacteroidales bacterium OttesenSCG-928-L03]
MTKHYFSLLLFLLMGTFFCVGQDEVVNTLKTELNRNFDVLKNEPIPAYYISVRVDEIQSLGTLGRLGRLQSPAVLNSPERILSTSMRVGDHNLDNSHEIRGSGWGGGYRNLRMSAEYVPYEDNAELLKTRLWLQLDELYKEDIQIYEQIKANIAVKVEQEDMSPDFSRDAAETYYEAPISWASLGVDPQKLEDKVRLYSAVFDENPDLLDGYAYFQVKLSRRIFLDTEGREITENAVSIDLGISADAWAEDGMYLPMNKSWYASSMNELPSDEEVLAAARELSQLLSELKKAPVVESFTGPAILSPEASGVFFHEIFGHRVEGTRLKQENDAQTFKKKVGERVLPKHFSVTFDPTRTHYGTTPLKGYYVFDDEGIRGQRVNVVENGVLKDFLMGRTPIEGFLHSNGHGRGVVGAATVSRQSNLIVESSQQLSDDELMKRLRKEAKKQGKEYAYYFKDVSGGFTNTDRYSPNSFNVTPLVVYRIYTDGRPSELVRGVDLVGTPLAMFSQIDACGDRYAVFNGMCGAESGSVPVSCTAPALLVKHIETQKRPKNQTQPPILTKPEDDGLRVGLSEGDAIMKAMREEVNRSLKGLQMDNLQPAFFISYTLGDMKTLQVAASKGALITSDVNPGRSTAARLMIGDYLCSDENYQGSTGGSTGYDGSPCLDNNVKGLRYTIWRDLDAIYKNAAETYEQKLATIKQLNIPAKDLELPDWDTVPVVVMDNLPRRTMDFNKQRYEAYVKEASAVFNEYPEILNSNVSVMVYDALIYFYNTEGTEFRYPLSFVYVMANAGGKNADGEDFSSSSFETYMSTDDLPSLEALKAECHKVARLLMEDIDAPKLEESYTGPVLFEDLAVVSVVYSNLIEGANINLTAQRKPLTASGFSYGGNSIEDMMDKRVTAREISIEALTGTKNYKGRPLLGYAPIDGQGVVPPERLALIENGILKTLLSDRTPTPKVPHSNGHALMGYSMGTGVTP